MKKYQIGNLTVEADSPVKALEIAKLFTKDSNIVDGIEKFYWNDVRQMCIRHNWYTHGDCAAYDRMLNAASNGQWTIDEIAFDIANHSDSSVSKAEVLAELKKIKLTDSKVKDSTKYAIFRTSDRHYLGNGTRSWVKKESQHIDVYNSKSEAEKILKQYVDDYDARVVEFTDSVKDAETYKGYKIEHEHGLGWSHYLVYIPEKRSGPYVFSDLQSAKNGIDKYLKGDRRVFDSDIDYLSKEEEKAIADYKAAIANTKDPKLLRLFAHILNEEIEHLEELQSSETHDADYEAYLNGRLLKRGDELTDFRGGKAWFYGCYHPRKITVLTKQNDPTSTMEYYPSAFNVEIK